MRQAALALHFEALDNTARYAYEELISAMLLLLCSYTHVA
jgi:hypothetical protein